MHHNRITLGMVLLQGVGLSGFSALPFSLDQHKGIIQIDNDLIDRLGLPLADAPARSSVGIDYSELMGRYNGVILDVVPDLKDAFAKIEHLDDFSTDVHDVGTMILVLGAPKALELKLASTDMIDHDSVIVVGKGSVINSFLDLFGPEASAFPRQNIAAFYAGEIFDGQPMPLKNGHAAESATA